MDKTTRAARFSGRAALREITNVPRCQDCGFVSVLPDGEVGVRRTTVKDASSALGERGVAGFSGLATCGSVWLCPVCNAKIMAKRAIDLGAVLLWASKPEQKRIQVIFGSVTSRHTKATDLNALMDVHSKGWAYVTNSKAWRAASATMTVPHSEHRASCAKNCTTKQDTVDAGIGGRVGYVRAAEITVGRNGWHPHFHPLIFFRGSKKAAKEFAAVLVRLWVEGIEDAGGEAVIDGGQRLDVLDKDRILDEVGAYMMKQTYDAARLALEVTWSQGKDGKPGKNGKAARPARGPVGPRGESSERRTRSYWSLLAEVEIDWTSGEVSEAVVRWQEFEEAMSHRRRRVLTWSRGIRTIAGLNDDEQTDEDAAAEETGTQEDTVCFLTAAGWRKVRDDGDVMDELLGTLERGGWESLRVFLDVRGIEYQELGTSAGPASEEARGAAWDDAADRWERRMSGV